MGFLAGKRAFIVGVATDRSIAWGIAQAMHREGAELAFSYVNDKMKERVEPLAHSLGSRLTMPLDVTIDAQSATAWKGLVVADNGVGPNGNVVGPADQRSQIKTFNIAPSWIRLVNSTTVLTLGAFVRRDQYNYYPSGNPFADLKGLLTRPKP